MKVTNISATLALGVVLSLISSANGAQYLTVNGQDVEAVTMEMGKLYSVEVVSTDSASYVAYVGFDNGVALGDFSHVQTKPEAGNLASFGEHDEPAFYGYYLSAAGFSPPPSAGAHFVFQYQPQQIGETDIKLYDQTLESAIDSVHVTAIRPTMGTAFTYQGRLIDDYEVADGLYDFQFSLFNLQSGGEQLGSTVDFNDLDVVDGQFAVPLDFGEDIFDGNAVWLETTVAHADGSEPNTLTRICRQANIAKTPHARCTVCIRRQRRPGRPDRTVPGLNSDLPF